MSTTLRFALALVLASLLGAPAGARAAVAADAEPDTAAPYRVTFVKSGRALQRVIVRDLRGGEHVGLSCRGCLDLGAELNGSTVTATGSRHVFRLRRLVVTRSGTLSVAVSGRNFGRTREYRLRPKTGRLALVRQRCSSIAEHRTVPCARTHKQRPWATMNVCAPAKVGIRAESPGGGDRRATVSARFTLQYQRGTRWLPVTSGTSPFVSLGPANRSFQGGYTFTFAKASRTTFRGVVDFQWQRNGKVIRRATRFTSPRRRVASGYSSSVCVLP